MDSRSHKALLAGLHAGLVIFYVFIAYLYYSTITDPGAKTKVPVGGDFINIWLGAKLTLEGRAGIIYDFRQYYEAQKAAFGANIEPHVFPYPPFFLLFTTVFGLLPYGLSCIAWLAGTFALSAWALRGFDRQGLGIVLLLALAPASYVNAIGGQNGFLSAALFIGGLALLTNRPVISGVLFGLLTFKPHLGLLIPLALIIRREWKAFAAAAATTLVLIGLGAAIFGVDMLRDYFGAIAYQGRVVREWSGLFLMMMPSAFMAVQRLDGPLWLSWGLQGVMAALAVALVIRVWKCSAHADIRGAALLIAAIALTHYVLVYDMTLTAAALVLLYPYMKGKTDAALALALWTMPLFIIFLNALRIPVGPLGLLGGLLLTLRCAQRHSATA